MPVWLIGRGATTLLLFVVIALPYGASAAAPSTSPSACAGSVAGSTQQTASAGHPCWVDVNPYPFGSDGGPVPTSQCQTSCLDVTSFAFRAWNRGLAATPGGPFGVWLYNGARWFPDPTFPGSKTCPGGTVLWAGKLDYWLIGQGTGNWPNICRFDGANFLWEPLTIPSAALAHVPPVNGKLPGGGITSGACYSYNNCWFFGSYGIVLHWDGTQLSDATPTLASSPWLAVDVEDAVTGVDSSGNPFGVAVADSTGGNGSPLPPRPGGAPPAQLFTSSGAGWDPAAFTPPANANLVAVSFDNAGRGWAAGVPSPRNSTGPDPLIPLVPQGQATGCDSLTTLGNPASNKTDSYTWTGVSAIPYTAANEAVAGGSLIPAGASSQEPVLVEVGLPATGGCTPSVIGITRFLGASGPVSPNGEITAVAMNAANDGWAAATGTAGAIHLYHFTDGTAPLAPAGDDNETRPLQLKEDPPIIVFAPLPPPPPPPPAPPPVVSTQTKSLPPAITAIHSHVKTITTRSHRKVKIHGRLYRETVIHQRFTLYVTFRVSRAVELGLQALRKGRLVSTTGLEHFAPTSGRLSLELTRKKWPTSLAFLTDQPKVTLTNPGAELGGAVTLAAAASAIKGRAVKSVQFEYSPHGANNWTVIGTATGSPFSVSFDTTSVPNGGYDLQAVATDSAGISGASAVLSNRQVQN